ADLILHQIAQAGRARRFALDGGNDPSSRRHTEIGRNQQLFERIDRFDVDRTRAPLRLVRLPDNRIEPFDDFLLRAGEAVANAAKERHGSVRYALSASARCRRNIRASSADRTSTRAASTSAT